MPFAPPMFPPQAPASQASAPSGNPGEMAAAMGIVRQSIKLLEQALPKLEVGTKQHEACVNAIRGLSKVYPEQNEAPGIDSTALLGLQRQSREGAMMRQLMQMQGQGQGGGGQGQPPGGAPAMAM